jgi:hypothetical protein
MVDGRQEPSSLSAELLAARIDFDRLTADLSGMLDYRRQEFERYESTKWSGGPQYRAGFLEGEIEKFGFSPDMPNVKAFLDFVGRRNANMYPLLEQLEELLEPEVPDPSPSDETTKEVVKRAKDAARANFLRGVLDGSMDGWRQQLAEWERLHWEGYVDASGHSQAPAQ